MAKTTGYGARRGAPTSDADGTRAETLRRNPEAVTQVSGALIGYARVSTEAQNDDRQLDALTEAGVVRTFVDHGVSSVKHRPALEEALAYLRPGDTLVVRELDRLGRRTLELLGFIEDLHARDIGLRILTLGIDTRTPAGELVVTLMAGVAQMEHSLLRERVASGLAAARSRGRVGGRPRVMTDKQIDHARRLRDQDGESLREIARLLGIPESTVRRRLAAAELEVVTA